MTAPGFPDTAHIVAALQEELQQSGARIVYLSAALRQTQESLTALQQAYMDPAPDTGQPPASDWDPAG